MSVYRMRYTPLERDCMPSAWWLSSFTEEERAAELKHCDHAIKLREEATEAWCNAWLQQAVTRCIHCGNPMSSWTATDPENPLCDICL